MNVLIIEDEPLAAENLQGQLAKIDSSIAVQACLPSVTESIAWLQANDMPDLIFCDIHLSDGLSFDIFKNVKVESPVIFTTAYDHYAIRAFEVNSISYLLKPVQLEKLSDSIDKYKNMQSNQGKGSEQSGSGDFNRLLDIIQKGSSNFKTRFLVKVGHKIKSVPVSKIAYFYTRERLNYIVTFNDDRLPVDHTLEEIDELVDPRYFFRVNRKFIIHVDAVKEIHPHFKGRLKLDLTPEVKEEIVVSAERTPLFKKWLDQ